MSRQNVSEIKEDAKKAASHARDRAEDTASDVAGTAQKAYEELQLQVEILKEELAALTGSVAQAGRAQVRDAADSVRKTGRKAARAAGGDGYDYATDQFDEALSAADDFTRDRPALALGLAAGAGFLLALAMLRR